MSKLINCQPGIRVLKWCVVSLLLQFGVAHSQTATSEQSDSSGRIEEVVVTGSRLARTGYDTPTPLTQLGQSEIETQASVDIATVVNQLPTMAGSGTATTSLPGMGSGTAGISSLNLRALGAGRTLVLLDGRRSSVSNSAGLVDTNTMPQGLIKRVEVVTGGASAAYGSGAIGGVVNFILDTDFTGIKSTLSYGETGYGDNANHAVSLAAGMPLSDGRGHLLFSAETSDVDGIHPPAGGVTSDGIYAPPRDWMTHGHFAMSNPNPTPGAPAYIVDNQISVASHTPGGLITSGPLMGTYFGVDGAVNQFAYGDVGGPLMRGGDWRLASQAGNMSLAAAEERDSMFLRGSYSLTPNLEIFGEASYAEFAGFANYIRVATLRIPIQRDNAFLPSEVASAMDDAGVNSFRMSTTNGDAPISGNEFSRDTQRYVLGANGLFNVFDSNVNWDFYYQRSVTDANQQYLPTIYHLNRMAEATDAVVDPVSGDIVCRSTLLEPGNSCVPLNRFGVGVADPAAWDYVMGAPYRDETYQMDVASFNVRPSELPGWAGPIGIAFGAEWRRLEISGEVEERYMSGWRFSNFKEDNGHYDLIEGYGEALVPIADGLDLNGAVRMSNYSTSGAFTTWKLGLNYSPVDDVTFRMTRSIDMRAPNLGELFATGTSRGNSTVINGVTVEYQQKLQGSTELDPEEATSWNAGIVVQPSFLPGFGASIDYYEIEVDGVIDSISPIQTVNFCFQAQIQNYCDNIHFADPSDTTTLEFIDIFFENLNRLSAKGVDIEATYQIGLADMNDAWVGDLRLRAVATHYIENVTDNGVTALDWAGSNEGDTPAWKYRLTALYSNDPWTINLTARGVSDGVIGNSYIECTSNCPSSAFPNYTIDNNSIAGQLVFDAYVSRRFNVGNADGEYFFSVKNLLDRDPPLTAEPTDEGSSSQPSFPQTNQTIFDILGRRFQIGVRINWGG